MITAFQPAAFEDRRAAGRALAAALQAQLPAELLHDALILALPRGGVPVAFEVARALRRPLDVFIVRKLGVPGQEELAMGALAGGGLVVLQPEVVHAYRIRQETIDAVVARERLEIERRESLCRAGRPPLSVAHRTVILIDDGVATGATMKAAARALRPIARRLVIAIPVAAPAVCDELAREADRVLCLLTPERFQAVGEFYRNFDQTTDNEVRFLLAQAAHHDDPSSSA